MARHESDRDDLFIEAVGLVRKLEGRMAGRPAAVILGFRADGVLVVYFGAEPMFQFDPAGRVRRAFVDGCLYRCQGETLAAMSRSRSETETTLVRHDLSPVELVEFRERLRSRVEPLRAALVDGQFAALRRFPVDDATLEAELAARLKAALTVEDWIAPMIRGKR